MAETLILEPCQAYGQEKPWAGTRGEKQSEGVSRLGKARPWEEAQAQVSAQVREVAYEEVRVRTEKYPGASSKLCGKGEELAPAMKAKGQRRF